MAAKQQFDTEKKLTDTDLLSFCGCSDFWLMMREQTNQTSDCTVLISDAFFYDFKTKRKQMRGSLKKKKTETEQNAF